MRAAERSWRFPHWNRPGGPVLRIIESEGLAAALTRLNQAYSFWQMQKWRSCACDCDPLPTRNACSPSIHAP